MDHRPAFLGSAGACAITIADEEVMLLPERALCWPRARLLVIADPHWGKAATFRAASFAVPEGATVADLDRLDRALDRSGAVRLAILGDLLHARAGRTATVIEAVTAWRARRPTLEILLVRGNHDARAGDPPDAWGITCINEPYALEPFVLCHYPDLQSSGYVLAGHLHPAVVLRGLAHQRERLPCFIVGARRAILPAFGSFTGAATVYPGSDERAYVVAGDQVVAVGG